MNEGESKIVEVGAGETPSGQSGESPGGTVETKVEIVAKKAAGYYTPDPVPDATILAKAVGRDLGD